MHVKLSWHCLFDWMVLLLYYEIVILCLDPQLCLARTFYKKVSAKRKKCQHFCINS